MPRQARQGSESGTYHIMLRGINRQKVFHDAEDYQRFIQTLARFKQACSYVLIGYCLMPNHVHLLIREGSEPLSMIFRRIGASYVYWYNTKYERTGHLFQDRYRSEAVEDDEYLLAALRYIHRNPIKAGLCKDCADYQYSSYSDYTSGKGITDTELILAMVGSDGFIEYHRHDATEQFLDMADAHKPRLSDGKAIELMRKGTGCDSPQAFVKLDREQQRAGIRMMLARGASIRQASRLTGISFSCVRQYAQNQRDGSP